MAQPDQVIETGISAHDLNEILNMLNTMKSSQCLHDVSIRPGSSSTIGFMPALLPPLDDMPLWEVPSPVELFSYARYSPMTGGLQTHYLDQIGAWHHQPENSLKVWKHGQYISPYPPFIPDRTPAQSHAFYVSADISNVSTPFHNSSSSRGTSATSPNSKSPCLSQTPVLFDRPIEPASTLAQIPQNEHPLLAQHFRDISQTKERDLLIQVLNSEWLAANDPEPQYMGKSILVGFLQRDIPYSALTCSFDGCGRRFDRQDRAVAHVRRQHLKFKPFACEGACGKSGCQERFASLAYWKGHVNKAKGVCYTCGKELTRKNLPRHSMACVKDGKGKALRSIHGSVAATTIEMSASQAEDVSPHDFLKQTIYADSFSSMHIFHPLQDSH